MAAVKCFVAGMEQNRVVSELASELIELFRGSKRPAGTIWIEFFSDNGATPAQVHYLPELETDIIKHHVPEIMDLT